MYRGGDRGLASSDWVKAHIHGHGPLGDLYPDYKGGDIWSSTLGQVRGIKEGDTPSFLSLVPNGLSDLERPWLGSWGGRFDSGGKHLTDIPDVDLETSGDPDPRMSSVHRWRPAFQADFQARLDWCVKPFAQANHPPVVRIEGTRERTARPGETVTLDARGTTDPDDDELTFTWSVYPADPAVAAQVVIEGRTNRNAHLVAAHSLTEKIVPILLTVRDGGTPSLTRYGRVLVSIPASR
jgi:hypothetical protein